MENKQFYIKYLTNGPVGLKTHILNTNTFEWVQTVFTVGDLLAAYKTVVAPLLDTSSLAQLTLHLPDDVAKSALSDDCFASVDENDTTLDTGCPLSALGSLGSKSKQPLNIKSGIVHGLTVGGMKNFVRKSIVTYWRVSGTISDSLAVKGVRSRMYRNADNHLGYYESGQPAFSYGESGTTLSINVLFETKENALRFDSHLRNESITIHSPMNSLTINSGVSTTSTAPLGERIYYKDYIPTDSESPQDTQSVITIQFSTFEETSDEFKYQRIEKLSIFGSMGKAESCHLMSGSHCRQFSSYSQFDKDPNNRLAMSRDLHGWFDHLNTEIPLFYLKVVSISESVIVEGRYKVVLAVVALNQESADMIFWRLIEGSRQTNDPLVTNTSVHVTNPTIFQKCLEWKEKKTRRSGRIIIQWILRSRKQNFIVSPLQFPFRLSQLLNINEFIT
jgi:hypothetical protein